MASPRKTQRRKEVELQKHLTESVLERTHRARQGWAEAARLMQQRGEDLPLNSSPNTRFDQEEWEWC